MSEIFSISNVQFLFSAFREAMSGIEWFYIAYIIIILFFFVIGRDVLTEAFVYPLFFLAITVFNPFVIVPLADVINLTSRIRRLLWLAPVNLVLAYAFAALATAPPKKSYLSDPPKVTPALKRQNLIRRGIAIVCSIVFIVGAGSAVLPQLSLPQNIYKVDNTLIVLADYLEADSKEKNLDKVVLYSDTLLLEMRQYDPSIEGVLPRSELLDFDPDLSDEEAIDEIVHSRKWLDILTLVSRFHLTSVDQNRFIKAASKYGVNYIIAGSNSGMGDYYTEAGYPLAATIGIFDVYRIEP